MDVKTGESPSVGTNAVQSNGVIFSSNEYSNALFYVTLQSRLETDRAAVPCCAVLNGTRCGGVFVFTNKTSSY